MGDQIYQTHRSVKALCPGTWAFGDGQQGEGMGVGYRHFYKGKYYVHIMHNPAKATGILGHTQVQ